MTEEIDWRADVVSTVAEDWVSPFTGITHTAGAMVAKVTIGRDARRRPLGFLYPSPEAMSLDLAIESARRSRDLRKTVVVLDPLRPGEPWTVRDEDLTALYDYLEACFVTVTFAFQALEAFANREIETAVPGAHEVVRKDRPVALTSSELQLQLSTDEKLGTLLPSLLHVRSPKGRAPWSGYRSLKRERDAIVHLKSGDAYSRGDDKRQSIFHRLLADGVAHHPRHSVRMLEWFFESRPHPSWLEELSSRADLAK